MADGVSINVAGIEGVGKALDELSNDLRKKVVRQALKDAAKPMMQLAKAKAPVLARATRRRRPGVLRSNIRVLSSKINNGKEGVIGVYLTVKSTRGARRKTPITGDPFYFPFVEGGHRIVPRGKGTAGLSKREIRSMTKAGLRSTITARRLLAEKSRTAASTGFVQGKKFFESAYRATKDKTVGLFAEAIKARVAAANR